MNFEKFKELHKKYSLVPLQNNEQDSNEYEEYLDAFYDNEQFSNWVLEQKMKESGFDYTSFCCVTMASHISDSLDEEGEIKPDDKDVIMNKWKDGTFGIPIHDGGTSIVKINFCPWCGSNLKNDE